MWVEGSFQILIKNLIKFILITKKSIDHQLITLSLKTLSPYQIALFQIFVPIQAVFRVHVWR